jgi:hypothetical protein
MLSANSDRTNGQRDRKLHPEISQVEQRHEPHDVREAVI